MNPVVALYLAIKRKESGRLQFIPVGEEDFGVVKVALVEGNVVGFDSTWGASLDNLKHLFGWRKAIIKKSPIDPSDHLVRVYVPRQEALVKLVRMEVDNVIHDLRDITPEEAHDLMKIRIGKRVPIPPEEVREIKEGKVEGKSFFLQRDPDYASVFVAGREVYTFHTDGKRVERITIDGFPEDSSFIVRVDHLVALTVSVPFFAYGREIDGGEVLSEVSRLKDAGTGLWHILLSSLGDIYVSILGYRGLLIGVFVLHGDEVKLKGEKSLKTIVQTIDLKGRLYEHGTGMRSA